MLIARRHGPVTVFRLARTLLGKGRYYTACAQVDGLLIDSGCAHTAPELAAALAELPLRAIVHTHAHEDHVAASAGLNVSRGARVYSPAASLDVVRGQAERSRLMPYQRVLWGWPAACPTAETLPEVIETPQHRFQVIATPGHSPDHVCLYEPDQGWLFVGDAYTGGRDRALRRGYDIHGIIASLKVLAGLPAGLMFTGSGSVVAEPAQALAEKIEYLEERGAYVAELRRRGWPLKIIASSVFGREPWISYITQGDFSRMNLVLSYLSPPTETAPPPVLD
ncbi:MAG: MBL fold metallo-hydrolase [Thermodesulfobacteriota bacterium]